MLPPPAEKMGKVWSIGSVEGKEEDGLVEKSVAEAMAGVEPNARSRKASYSLRFFKEGLPHDDKTRRRETKNSSKDKLPKRQKRRGRGQLTHRKSLVTTKTSTNHPSLRQS
ncbi:hypothetical protein V2G26_001521 [Clonostachys chloroleuca]